MTHSLVIFDWDGTLMDSEKRIVKCMQKAFELNQLKPPTDLEVKQIIGISLLPAVELLLCETLKNKAQDVVEAYKDVFINQDKTPTPLFDDVLVMLDSLKSQSRILAGSNR